jgi:methylmalonyl-CoA mutase N-terminal domain/subunit
MARVEDMGGAVAAIERNFQKEQIERAAYHSIQQIEQGEKVVVGLNRFVRPDDERYEPLRADPTIEERQVERLSDLRARRQGADVRRELDALRRAAEVEGSPDAQGTEANVLYPMHDALRARATVGEVCNALRDVWGEHTPTDAF